MYTVSISLPINPTGVSPELNQDQVWQGLVMKAEDATQFVPIIKSCHILERYPNGLLREISIAGDKIKEKITFTPKIDVRFDRVETEDEAGWIANTISESDQGLLLSFTFAVNFKGVQPGSDEEREQGEKMKGNYRAAIEATLNKIRELVDQKKL
jgi:hypothetical protein